MLKKEIIDPTWADEKRDRIHCKFKLMDDSIVTAAISIPPGGTNPDWDEIMEKFGEDVLEKNLQARLENQRKVEEQQILQERQNYEVAQKEALFNIKAEAFELDSIKQSKNKAIKNKIRRAGSILEVTIYTTALFLSENPDLFKSAEDLLENTSEEESVEVPSDQSTS